MKNLLIIFLCVSAIFSINTANAQMALGLRFSPDGVGFTGKFFINNPLAFELQMNTSFPGSNSYTAVGLFEYHIPFSNPSFHFLLGGGAHIGGYENGGGIFGIDGIMGVEYVLKNTPLGLSVDFKPAVNFVGGNDWFGNNALGLAARVYL
jgi:hypothetical protein